MSSTIFNSLIGFIFWVIITRFFTTESVGFAGAIMSTLGLLAGISELGLGIGLIRFLPDAGDSGNDMINTILTISGMFSLVLSAVYIAGLGFWSPALVFIRENYFFCGIFMLFTFVWTLNPFTGSIFLTKLKSKYILMQEALTGLIKIILLIPLILFFSGPMWIVVASGISILIPLGVALFLLIPKIQSGYVTIPTLKMRSLKPIIHYSTANYIARVFLEAHILIIPIMVVNILGPEINAFFYIAWLLSIILRVIPNSLSNSLFAESSNDETFLLKNAWKTLLTTIILLLPAILVISVLAEKILLLFGRQYSHNGIHVLRVLLFANIPWSINYLFISIGRVRKEANNVIGISVLIFICTVGLSYFLMTKIGLLGVGLGYLTGQTIVAMTVLIIFFKRQFCLNKAVEKSNVASL